MLNSILIYIPNLMKKNKKNNYPPVALKFLRDHSLFGGLCNEELCQVRKLLTVKSFPAGKDIIREGEAGGDLYLIWKGSVEVIKKDPEAMDTAPVRLAILRKGDSFGEMELIDVQPNAASVRALEDTVTLILSNGDLYLIEQTDLLTFTMIIMNLAREVSRRLRTMDAVAAHTLFNKSERSTKI